MPAADEAAAATLERMIEFAFPRGRFDARGTWWKTREITSVGGRDQIAESFVRLAIETLDHTTESVGKVWSVPFSVGSESVAGEIQLKARILGMRVPILGRFARRGAGAVLSALPFCPFALDHPQITWRTVDDTHLEASRASAGVQSSVTFAVDASGRIASFQPEPVAFFPKQRTQIETLFDDYEERLGVTVPARGSTLVDVGRHESVGRFTVTDWAISR